MSTETGRPANGLAFKFLLALVLFSSALVILMTGMFCWATLSLAQARVTQPFGFVAPATTFDPELGWAPQPNYHAVESHWGPVSTNPQGFRSPGLIPGRPAIVLVGDSVVWGFGVGDGETLSSALTDRLGSQGPQVVNLGVPGYTTDQEYFWLKRVLPSLRNVPLKEIVLVISVFNDLGNLSLPYSEGREKPVVPLKDGRLEGRPGRVSKYGLLNLVCAMPLSGRVRNSVLKLVSGTAPSIDAEAATAALLEGFVRLSRTKGARFTIVLSPSRADFEGGDSEYGRYERILSRHGYEFLDFKKTLALHPPPASFFLPDGVHYKPQGNRLLASSIAARLRSAAH
jgi:lysophospholipase L1-like esterase